MKTAAAKGVIEALERGAMLRFCRRRVIEASVALICGLLAGTIVQAAILKEDDIVGLGLFSDKLIRIDGKTGKRSVISEFSNPAQGPVLGGYDGVAVSEGRIFVTGQNGLGRFSSASKTMPLSTTSCASIRLRVFGRQWQLLPTPHKVLCWTMTFAQAVWRQSARGRYWL